MTEIQHGLEGVVVAGDVEKRVEKRTVSIAGSPDPQAGLNAPEGA